MDKKRSYRHKLLRRRGQNSKYLLSLFSMTLLLSACGGSGGGADDNPDGGGGTPSDLPILSIDSSSVMEGDTGTTPLTFTATLDKTDAADVTVDFASADGTATAGSDYQASSGVITIPAGALSSTLDIIVIGDTQIESDETFSLNLSNISSNATLGATTATGTILNDDEEGGETQPPTPVPSSSALNDTGVTTCSDDFASGLDCSSSSDGTDDYTGQDAEHGRDITNNDDSDGAAGFSFTKLDSSGNALGDQTADYVVTPWSCVQDEITGLMWEVKTNEDGLQDRSWTYSWYFSSGTSTTIDDGTAGYSNGGDCVDDQNCDTEKYVNAVNAINLCGYDDWRLPSRRELLSIMHFGAEIPNYIDTNFFPNHVQFPYWSDSKGRAFNAYFVEYSSIGALSSTQTNDYSVRLVRGGQ